VANWYNVDTFTASPSQINFLIFSSIWSLISLAFLELVPKFAPRGKHKLPPPKRLCMQLLHGRTAAYRDHTASHPYAALAFECSNVLFWFAGAVALGVFMSQLLFCRNSVCSVAQADVAISAMTFVSWVVSIFFIAKDMFKGGLRKPASTTFAGAQMKESTLA